SETVSLLLRSGDELKTRIDALSEKDPKPWDTSVLTQQLKTQIALIKGTSESTGTAENLETIEKSNQNVEPIEPSDFLVNHELLAELMGESQPKQQIEAPAPESNIINKPVVLKVLNNSEHEEKAVTTNAPPPSSTKAAPKSTTQKNSSGSIKVDNYRNDSVLDAVGELVVLKNQLVHDETIKKSENHRLESIVGQLDKSIKELYEKTLSIRMTPFKSLFIKLQRLVRDVSLQLNKPVHFELIGEDTEVDRTVAEILNDPMVHIVRNALDHGIEKPDQREASGKNKEATLIVSAKQSGGNVLIEVTDDGAGINRDKVLKKAIEKGLISKDTNIDSIPDEEVFQMLFAAGFSTADKVSDLSGRGVGLDVVKSNLDKINGKISISSTQGKGSVFRLTIPLTTSITDGIDVTIKGHRFILPIHSIREIVRVSENDFTNLPDKGSILKIREELIQVLESDLMIGKIKTVQSELIQNNIFSETKETSTNGNLFVILESLHRNYALRIDEIMGQAQVVVKSMSLGFNIHEIAGAAIMGDGQTVLILDPTNMINDSELERSA
ncbi:MAG TPA: chemotaxis protein CheA, partial [Pseudobdellovibrionaceae bacterium]|nr:chemotaxis protein CheA [Pseudobdellovibrionaceae bacterium]